MPFMSSHRLASGKRRSVRGVTRAVGEINLIHVVPCDSTGMFVMRIEQHYIPHVGMLLTAVLRLGEGRGVLADPYQ